MKEKNIVDRLLFPIRYVAGAPTGHIEVHNAGQYDLTENLPDGFNPYAYQEHTTIDEFDRHTATAALLKSAGARNKWVKDTDIDTQMAALARVWGISFTHAMLVDLITTHKTSLNDPAPTIETAQKAKEQPEIFLGKYAQALLGPMDSLEKGYAGYIENIGTNMWHEIGERMRYRSNLVSKYSTLRYSLNETSIEVKFIEHAISRAIEHKWEQFNRQNPKVEQLSVKDVLREALFEILFAEELHKKTEGQTRPIDFNLSFLVDDQNRQLNSRFLDAVLGHYNTFIQNPPATGQTIRLR